MHRSARFISVLLLWSLFSSVLPSAAATHTSVNDGSSPHESYRTTEHSATTQSTYSAANSPARVFASTGIAASDAYTVTQALEAVHSPNQGFNGSFDAPGGREAYHDNGPITLDTTTWIDIPLPTIAASRLIADVTIVPIVTTEYDALNRPWKTTTNYENGDPLSICGDGSPNGSSLTLCDADGNGVVDDNRPWASLTDTDQIQVTEYRPDGQVARSITNWIDGVYDAAHPDADRVTVPGYDAIGRQTSTTRTYVDGNPATGSSDTDQITRTIYDSVGRVQASQDVLGRYVHQHYDALGRVDQTIQNCRNSSGTPVSTGCAAFAGGSDPNAPTSLADRNIPQTTGFDALGRVETTTDAYGRVSRTQYDGLGRVLVQTQNYVDGSYTSSAPDTDISRVTSYDALGRVRSTQDPSLAITRQQYNGLGQTTVITDSLNRVTQLGYDGQGQQRWTMTPDGRVSVVLIDGLGRSVATIQHYQDGVSTAAERDQDLISRTVYDRAGRVFQQSDAGGQVTQFAYDQADRLLAVTENATSGACPKTPCNVVTWYQYDRAGNRVAHTDANSHTRTWTYDAADRMVTATDALNQVMTWHYDAAGRVTSVDDPRGASNNLSYQYTDLDQQQQVQATNLGTLTQQYNALGQRTSMSDGTGTTSFQYDAMGRMTQSSAPQTGAVGYGYDARGLRTGLTYPDGTQIQYQYRADGSLEYVIQGSTTLASYGYDAVGRLGSVTRANGVVTSYGYDGVDRLTSLTSMLGSQPISGFAYTLDRQGLRRQLIETLPQLSPTTVTPTATSGPGTSTPTATSVPATSTPTATSGPPTSTPTATPGGSSVLAQDSFSRTTSTGWGTADVGGAWTTTMGSSSDYSTASGNGRITFTTTNVQREQLLSVSGRDVDTTLRMAMDALPVGNDLVVSLIGRRISAGNDYRAQLVIQPSGAVKLYLQRTLGGSGTTILASTTIAGLTATPNSFLRMRMQMVGTGPITVRARVWADGSPEPTTWQRTVDDTDTTLAAAGGVGVRVYHKGSNVPLVASIDDLLSINLSGGATATPTATSVPATAMVTATPIPATSTPTRTNTPTATVIPPTATALPGTSTPTSTPPSGLVAAYSFDAGSGSTVADTTGNGHTGTLVNGPSWTTSGKYGGALSFDGVNDLVSIADTNDLDLSTGMTLSAWVKPSTVTTWRSVIVKTNGANDLAYALYAFSDGANTPRGFVNIGGSQQEVAGGTTLAASTWTHLATTYDGTTLRVYINGTQVGQRSLSGSLLASSGALELGGNTSYGTEWFAGLLDDVRVYNRALSASEIVSDRDTPVGGSSPPATPTATSVSATSTPTRTSTPTATTVPATATAIPPTATAIPPTATAIPPTATALPPTATALPPTATALPPTATALPGTRTPTSTPPSGLVAAYSFDAGSGSTVADTTGNGHTGTLVNGPSWTASGKHGGALSFDGVNDLVSIADASDLDLSTGMTLSAWVKPTAVGTWQSIIFKTNGSQDLAYALYAFSDGSNNNVRGYLTTGGQVEVAGGSTLTAQTWAHLALTYDGTTMRLYVDGTQVAQRAESGSMVATTGALELGGNTSYGNEWFAGLLDDVRIYNRALSASEIALDQGSGVGDQGSGAIPRTQADGDRDQGSGVRDQESGIRGQDAAPDADRVASRPLTPDPRSLRAALPNPDSPIFTSFGKALLRQLQPSIATTTRTITYDYDGLQRLTSASESPGTTQTYAYDLAGNRTGVWVNGTRTQNYSYNAANQVTGWSYDAAGNLLNDGAQSYSYDALGRVLTVGTTSNQYNADGTLVAQTANSVTTRYVQDLAASLSQILSDGTQRYVYGSPAERLFAQQGSSARTWYSTDALGSVRATLSDAGIPHAVANYDAWGVPETAAIAPFGFTGELQQGSDVWLRARWYGAVRGSFGGRDAYQGEATRPYSLMPYQYASANPISRIDPSGMIDCANGTSICYPEGGYGGMGGSGTSGWGFHLGKTMEVCLTGLASALGLQTAPQEKEYLLPDEYVVPEPKKELPGPPVDTTTNDERQIVYRFADRNNPETIRSNLSRLSPDEQQFWRDRFTRTDRRSLENVIITHSSAGAPFNSPFVSVLIDHQRASLTPDKWLSTIIWGVPGVEGREVQRAPDLGTFHVPRALLVDPDNPLSANETEKLFWGDDLGPYLVEWRKNPYYPPRPAAGY